MKSAPFYGMRTLQVCAQIIAATFCVALLMAAGIETFRVFLGLLEADISSAIQDGLFVLILLEMFYVVRSFIKYGSVNTSLIISVGIVAIVKEVIFKLDTLDLYASIAFTILLIAFCIGFLLEDYSQKLKIHHDRKPRSLKRESEKRKTETQKAEESILKQHF